jgi:formate dehydrogenase subunit delta
MSVGPAESPQSGSLQRLRYMADQIARNFQSYGRDKAVLATADHIDMYWDPRMKAMIFADDRAALGEVAGAAIEYLARGNHPEHQTRATEFNKADEIGHSDAG